MYYVGFDNQGKITAFYNKAVHANIPQGVIEITDEQHQHFLNNIDKIRINLDSLDIEEIKLPLPEPNPIDNSLTAVEIKYSSIEGATNLQSAVDDLASNLNKAQDQIKLLSVASIPKTIESSFTAADNTRLAQYQGEKLISSWVDVSNNWSIKNNQASSPLGIAYTEAIPGKCICISADVTLGTLTSNSTIMCRYDISSGSYLRVGYFGKRWVIGEFQGGKLTLKNSIPASFLTMSETYNFKVILEGERISFYLNDTKVCSATSILNSNSIFYGIYSTNLLNTFANFQLTVI